MQIDHDNRMRPSNGLELICDEAQLALTLNEFESILTNLLDATV
jgi:hypothetical protein